jgi:hypothetical protein
MPVTAKRDTGHGATVTFGTTSWSGKLVGIPTNLSLTRPPVDITYLGTSGEREYMAGDVSELGQVTLDVAFESATGLPALGTTPETITITWPLAPGGGGVTAANLAGTGIITGVVYPAMQTNTMQQGQITFQYDGNTGPTWTAEA